MKRCLYIFLICLFLVPLFAIAETETEVEAAPESDVQEISIASDTFTIDFSSVYPDNPAATPVAVDPIDKPTPTPMPSPNFSYQIHQSDAMGISFSIPFTWLLNPVTNQSTMLQFVEPQSEMMDVNGYQTRLTIEYYPLGLGQTVSDARAKLEEVLVDLSDNFTSFIPGSIASATLSGAKGSYCYYKCEYNDGNKTYLMNGRIMVVAYGSALYQVRITAPRSWYTYYENVFRRVRSSWKFL